MKFEQVDLFIDIQARSKFPRANFSGASSWLNQGMKVNS